MSQLNRSHVLLAILFGVWFVAEICAMPFGNFPLNDDWNYAVSVKQLLEQGGLTITVWSLAASLTHILTGAAVTSVFGFSFEILRLTTVAWSVIGALCFYMLLRRYGTDDPVLATIATGCLVFNPIYFELSNTFMTDVPFVALSLLSMLFLMRAVDLADYRNAAVATATTAAACLMRQVGLVIPISSALVALSIKDEAPKSRRWLTALMPLAITGIAVLAFQAWFHSSGVKSFSYITETAYLQQRFGQGIVPLTIDALKLLMIAIIYLGLFIIPVAPFLARQLKNALSKQEWTFLMLFISEMTVLIFGGLLYAHRMMPLGDNILFDFGLGPIFTGGSLQPGYWESAHPIAWMVLTFLATACGSLATGALAIFLLQKKRGLTFQPIVYLPLLIVVLHLTIICLRGYFDRYLIFTLPFMLLALIGFCNSRPQGSREWSNFELFPGVAALAAFMYFSSAGTHDYFAFNRAKWESLEYLRTQAGVSPMLIDGGLEFNGWYSYAMQKSGQAAPSTNMLSQPLPSHSEPGESQNNSGPAQINFDPSMKHGDEFIVSLTGQPGYRDVRQTNFDRWLIPSTGTIHVLRKLHY